MQCICTTNHEVANSSWATRIRLANPLELPFVHAAWGMSDLGLPRTEMENSRLINKISRGSR